MAEKIPVVDLEKIALYHVDVPNSNYEQVGRSFCQALSTCGFAYLANHGVKDSSFPDLVQEAQKFFYLDQRVKTRHARDADSIHGYSQVGQEVLESLEIVECKESFDVAGKGGAFPKATPHFKSRALGLANQCVMLAMRLLRCMASDLGVDFAKFLGHHQRMFKGEVLNPSCLRILRYPAIKDSCKAIPGPRTRCGAHSDYGGLTLLFQDDLGGLEIQSSSGDWIKATPIPGTIVVNIGDLMAFWSGHRYKATIHRVRIYDNTASKDRYSVAFFAHPDNDTLIVPFDETKNSSDKRYLTAKEHVSKRFKETYIK